MLVSADVTGPESDGYRGALPACGSQGNSNCRKLEREHTGPCRGSPGTSGPAASRGRREPGRLPPRAAFPSPRAQVHPLAGGPESEARLPLPGPGARLGLGGPAGSSASPTPVQRSVGSRPGFQSRSTSGRDVASPERPSSQDFRSAGFRWVSRVWCPETTVLRCGLGGQHGVRLPHLAWKSRPGVGGGPGWCWALLPPPQGARRAR